MSEGTTGTFEPPCFARALPEAIRLSSTRSGAIFVSPTGGRRETMTRLERVSRFAILLVSVLTIGCENEDNCTRARTNVAKTWESVKNLATKRKFPPVDEADNPIIKQQRLERWQPVEDRAALLESSFVTPQVTWQSATKAKSEINQQFAKIPDSDDRGIPRFASLLDKANRQQADFEQNCR
jgi:hypothetical protein